MSTAAPAKQNPQQGYSVSKPQGTCAYTNEPINPGDKMMAMVVESPAGLDRLDYKLEAWDQDDQSKALAFWQTVMPAPDQVKKKLFVDDEVLCTLFEKLSETTEENKIQFRFILGLILMRKRLLVYESSQIVNGNEEWTMRRKGKEDRFTMINPRLNEEQVKSVSAQLGEIMNEEL